MIRIILAAFFLSNLLDASWHLYPTYPKYLKKRGDLIRSFYFKADTKHKIVALTFDGGPNKHTPKIMAVLNKYKVPATFFLIGKNIRQNSYKLYQNKLFDTGMHSAAHANFDKISPKAVMDDFAKTIAIFQKNHLDHKLFRPPYGVVNKAVVNSALKYHIKGVLWSNDTFDWDKKRRSHKAALEHLGPGDIILMHDHATKPAELEALIRGIQTKGYKIVSLKELMKHRSQYP